jgi:hypothetical protein
MAQNVASQLERNIWLITWASFALGLIDDPDTSQIKFILDPIKTGTTGKTKIGERFIGLEGDIICDCRESTRGLIWEMLPWNTGTDSGGAVVLTPPLNVDLFTYAQPLRLHAQSDGSSNARDLVLGLATPVHGYKAQRQNTKDDFWRMTFTIYPSRTNLIPVGTNTASLSYGTAGGA